MIPGMIVAVLAVLALIYVSAPVRHPRPDADDDQATPEAEARKVAALSAILDLESERDMGKLAEADFDELRSTYEHDALLALAELDAAEALPATDPLEREIAAMRERLRAGRCPKCGADRAPGATCSRCGA